MFDLISLFRVDNSLSFTMDGSGDNMGSSMSHGEGIVPSKEFRKRQVNLLEYTLEVLNSDKEISRAA